MTTATIAVLAAMLLAADQGRAAPGPPPRVFAFVSGLGGREVDRLRAVGDRIDVVAPNWFEIEVASGAIRGGGRHTRPLRQAARASNTSVWPVVNARTRDSRTISRASWRGRVARGIEAIARKGHYAGMTIDIEEIAPDQGPQFTALVRDVARRLHGQGRRLAVYVPRPFTNYGAAYDWAALAEASDLLLASGYNEHASSSRPGPVATAGGFESVLAKAATISQAKIAPTIGAFGYRWSTRGGPGELVSTTTAQRIRARCGASGMRSDGSISFRCSGGVVFYESTAGLVARAAAARRAGFPWLGLFSLGREPRTFWRRVETHRHS